MTAERSFSFEDQLRFARLSGDANPLHVDSAWAAIVFPGEPVVHGMHALLWGLESTWPGGPISAVTATFVKPILLGEHVTASLSGNTLTVTYRDEPMVVTRVESSTTATRAPAISITSQRTTDSEWLHRSGTVTPPPDDDLMVSVFPRLAAAFGKAGLRGMASLSTLVGMECPGLRGMFADFSVTIPGSTAELTYKVTAFDRRFNRLTMAVDGCLTGTVAAFVGSSQPEAPTDADLRRLVKADEFKDQRPLIIGGSAGLGAISSLLLASGGARPIITYHTSLPAAERIAARITALGAACDVIHFDVRDPKRGLEALSAYRWKGAQAYYFATPRIFRRRLEIFQAKDLYEFMQIYVDSFYELVRTLMRDRGVLPLTIFYPSSTAIEDGTADLFEYAVAKQAGERLCDRLRKKYKQLSIDLERLPRIDTRQTQTFVKAVGSSPHEVMLPVIRRVQRVK
jgi:hypothetical protein